MKYKKGIQDELYKACVEAAKFLLPFDPHDDTSRKLYIKINQALAKAEGK